MEEQVACLKRLQVAYEEGTEAGKDRSDGEAEGDKARQMDTRSDRTAGRQADRL